MKKFEIDLELMNNIFMHFINTDINFENKNIFQQILLLIMKILIIFLK